MAKVLILGGTREALQIAIERTQRGDDVTTSLAGRTREPTPPQGRVRIGGFGGVEGLAKYLKRHKIDELIDATHPFATTISANAKQAAKLADTRFTHIQRAPWQQKTGDQWIEFATLEDAALAIPKGARVLLALGSQHIALFATRADVHFTIRRIDEPTTALPFAQHTLILGKPGQTVESEVEVLRRHTITHIVCRNSGGTGAYAKIEAARQLQIPVLMIERPAE